MKGNIPITPISVFKMPKTPIVNIKINRLFRLVKKTTPISNKIPHSFLRAIYLLLLFILATVL
jgi:hypothetical protein